VVQDQACQGVFRLHRHPRFDIDVLFVFSLGQIRHAQGYGRLGSLGSGNSYNYLAWEHVLADMWNVALLAEIRPLVPGLENSVVLCSVCILCRSGIILRFRLFAAELSGSEGGTMRVARGIGLFLGACWIALIIDMIAFSVLWHYSPDTIRHFIRFGGMFVQPWFILSYLSIFTLLYGLVRLLMVGLRVAKRRD
jgi:hypothetical protein